jgi:cytochrome c oxidase subunit 3
MIDLLRKFSEIYTTTEINTKTFFNTELRRGISSVSTTSNIKPKILVTGTYIHQKLPKLLNLELKFQRHPYHLVDPSPWPIAISFVLLILTLVTAFTMHGYIKEVNAIFFGLILLTATMALWLRDVVTEGTFLGHHTSHVKKGLSIGFVLFIISEAFFFLSIFWAFFHSSLSPTVDIGLSWPPYGMEAIKPFDLPLTNTILLLSSGATLTYSHHSLINKQLLSSEIGLILTIVLALIFTFCQGVEYYYAPFTLADSVFGSVFFFGTGFHGVHVIVGTIMLVISLIRMYNYHFTTDHHVGFESAILYWHFVDVVWLLLYVAVYWWGS